MLMDQEQQNKVTDHFTQYGHNFWGTPSENNYGFGSSNISENIERLSKQFMTPPSSSTSFLDQSLIEEPQATGSLFDTPVGYQSLLDDSSNNFLEEATSYPTSSYNSLTSSTPQSLMQSSVQAPVTTSLTGGLSQNTFGTSLNNFSYPNALGTGGGTLTERMAATLSARETPYNFLSGDATSSMSELSGNSFNSSLSSDFSNNGLHQNDPVWQKLSSYSIDQLNELGELIKKAKEEERLYGSSPIKQSLFNLLGGIKQAHAGTLSSQGINNEPDPYQDKLILNLYITDKKTGKKMYKKLDLKKGIDGYMDALQLLEGTHERLYFDPRNIETIGIGKRVTPNEIYKNHIWNLPKEKQEALVNAIDIVRPLFNKENGLFKKYRTDEQPTIFENVKKKGEKAYDGLTSEQVNAMNLIYSYPLDSKRMKELVYEHYILYGVSPIKGFLELNDIDPEQLSEEEIWSILDVSYNSGDKTPLFVRTKNGGKTYYPKFAQGLKHSKKGVVGVQTKRIGVGRNRNNFTLLRPLPEFKHLDSKTLYKFVNDNIKEELTPQNFPIYQKRFNWKTNPFKENEEFFIQKNFYPQ